MGIKTLMACLLAMSCAVGAEEVSDSDWKKIAGIIIHRSVQLAPGERVIIHYLPGREPDLLAALRHEIVTSGGIISAELTWPTKDLSDYFDSLSAEQKARRAQAENQVYREIFARSDVYLWLDETPLDDLEWRQFERLIGESKVRAVHSHFQGAPDPQKSPELWKSYLQAISMEPGELKAIEHSLSEQLRGATAHLTSPQGTDLTFKVEPDAWFHENTGDASKTKARNPRSVRDREEEIPSGDIRTTNVTAANGKLVGAVFGNPDDVATLTFKNGRLVAVDARGKDGAEFAKWFASAQGDRDRIGELVIGNNPYLLPVAAANYAADFGYAAGTVRVDIGENWESGGSMRTGDHQQFAFIVVGGTLRAGHTMLIDRGKPVQH
jgi:leucyl aminopeptidase (aminopeptidase T)